ncbi:thiamine phosphate synthase [Candidatus Pelagibacter sp.]|nr:thiamine phosphate synthase [Candidatus Pelagibacter sp.]
MKINKNKFLYLISPNKINKSFYKNLTQILRLKKTSFFQLRLKRESFKNKIKIGIKIKTICKKYNVKFLINDDPHLAKKINTNGCHLGQNDMNINDARKLLKKNIIGVTCHNSIKLAKIAIKNKADYIALGAFNSSKTKKIKYKAKIDLIKKVKKLANIPIVAIGGINNLNYKKLLLNNADFLAISGYIWNNKKLKPVDAIKILK